MHCSRRPSPRRGPNRCGRFTNRPMAAGTNRSPTMLGTVKPNFTPKADLVVGLGSKSVLEAGIRLHHTYGLPMIPGSALKGLASHYCNRCWGQWGVQDPPRENRLFRRNEKGSHHELLFGTTNDGGVIAFHDAWITPESLRKAGLMLDVMTPHHPAWQIEGGAPPTDLDKPAPVPFLSVSGTFRVCVSWVGPRDFQQAEKWTELAFCLLTEALAEWGIGGKTSSGYGRLVPCARRKCPLRRPPRQRLPRLWRR